ncbi:hypothetical protein P9E76_15410 [Schinkia azotoformans]|uniref:Uncharacterized protein n=1 Tax=Schinkia azotoformans LMG 9581 TaxID=1131731 RepID=K6CAC5_SCHAZ|nr:hypothetical protein [Schinkia azotoformans]EKN68060.1 hypothetical protein BAZO_06069 [Schinkia azotoformans LMG 9581]MEC1638134.1 hypothetical protein [Schinkia azotoformans]MEC1946432.1 hypothetical protein [Schinkia azotoformans]MED4354083.1 hypothetical protein [Schinkia azotoformans]
MSVQKRKIPVLKGEDAKRFLERKAKVDEKIKNTSETFKKLSLKDVFKDNRDKIIELAESNTVRNEDGLTVLTDEERKQSMDYRKRSWERD